MEAVVQQYGTANESDVTQTATGAGALANIYQDGDQNGSDVTQNGNAEAYVTQIGDLNKSSVAQAAGTTGSQAFVSQLGNEGYSLINQNGGDNTASVTTTDTRVIAQPYITARKSSGEGKRSTVRG